MADERGYPMRDHSDEQLRQAAVFASGVLAMRGNPRLQDIVDRAAKLFDCPMVAVSVVDRNRQWFPASRGLNGEDTAREASFCQHTIMDPEHTMVVPDAQSDSRFAENPLVTGAPGIRFYAGAPLVTRDGKALGALCVIDSSPRAPLTPEATAELEALAREAVAEIESVEHLRRFGAEAIEFIVAQIRDATHGEDEALIRSLDKVLRRVEEQLGQGMGWPRPR